VSGSQSPIACSIECPQTCRCVRVPPADFITPCLPTSAPRPPSGDLWLHQIKHDDASLKDVWGCLDNLLYIAALHALSQELVSSNRRKRLYGLTVIYRNFHPNQFNCAIPVRFKIKGRPRRRLIAPRPSDPIPPRGVRNEVAEAKSRQHGPITFTPLSGLYGKRKSRG
jgi:hypothetical protein